VHEHAAPGLSSQLQAELFHPSLQRDLDYDHRSIEPDIDRDGPSLGL
jgi:hypothetical protein